MARLEIGSILNGGWESFQKDVIPPEAGPIQVLEMKKAFFGGAHVILATMLAVGDSDVPDEVGAQVLDSLHKELQAFAVGLVDNGPGGATDETWH